MQEEMWLKINYPFSNYEVSNLGRVRKAGCKVPLPDTQPQRGYVQRALKEEGSGNWKLFRVHRLVAQAFLKKAF